MKRLLLGLALLVLLVAPALGFSLTFQNSGDFSEYISIGGTGSTSYVASSNGGNSYMITNGNIASRYSYFINTDPLVTDYAAISILGVSTPTPPSSYYQPTVWIYDATMASLASYTFPNAETWNDNNRIEMVMSGGSMQVYKNDVLRYTSPKLAQNPSYVAWGYYQSATGGSPYVIWDDLVYGSSENHYIFSAPEEGYYLKKDMINPANSGLYSPTGVLISNYNMTSTWGKASSTTETVYLQNFVTAVNVGSVSTGSALAGSRAWPIADDIFNNPNAEYGYYVTTIPGSGEYSQVIPYIGDGASVTFNAAQYSVGDTATIDYTILGGGYWDTATYTYKMEVRSIYGTTVSSQAISTQTGSKSYTFADTDTTGVYYAVLLATPIAGGDDIWMGIDTTELSAYVTITGWINNAETGSPIAGSKINITQDTQYNFVTTVDGNYSTTTGTPFLTGATLTLNATATGFDQYLFSFTPLTGSTKAINITLVPSAPSVTGIGINGIVRETVYGRPISSATVAVTNTTHAESYSVITNNVGYYLLDESDGATLTNGRCYLVSASKTGYGTDSALKCVVGV